MSCPICSHSCCTGRYILHPKEMKFTPQIKQKELAEDPSVKFELVDSSSSGEIFYK